MTKLEESVTIILFDLKVVEFAIADNFWCINSLVCLLPCDDTVHVVLVDDAKFVFIEQLQALSNISQFLRCYLVLVHSQKHVLWKLVNHLDRHISPLLSGFVSLWLLLDL